MPYLFGVWNDMQMPIKSFGEYNLIGVFVNLIPWLTLLFEQISSQIFCSFAMDTGISESMRNDRKYVSAGFYGYDTGAFFLHLRYLLEK